MTPTGAELRAKYGKPVQVDPAEALRVLGLRDKVHPRDAFAFLHPSQEVADLFAASNLEHRGHPNLGSYPAATGVVGVVSIMTDPSLPDDFSDYEGYEGEAAPMASEAVPSTAGGGPRDFSEEVHSHFTKPPAPGEPGSITMQVILSEADAGKVTSLDLAAAITALLARHGITSGYRIREVTGEG